jgi:hypothetical protein
VDRSVLDEKAPGLRESRSHQLTFLHVFMHNYRYIVEIQLSSDRQMHKEYVSFAI